MDGSRDYHTKWSKLDRERQRLYDIIYMWNLKGKKKTQMNLLPKQELTHRHRKETYGSQKGKGRLGEARMNTHTTLYKTDNQRRPAGQHRELELGLRSRLWGNRSWGQGDDRRRRGTEDELVGRHHWLNAQESEQTPGNSEGQGSLARLGSQGVRQDIATEHQ